MFGIGKKKPKSDGIPKDIIEFLDEADRLYIRAFETRTISLLKDYFTYDCCKMISNYIVAEGSSRYFSDEKFRDTTWRILESTTNSMKLEKLCEYENIRISSSRHMKVSEDYKEHWELSITSDEVWVTNIIPVDMF